jgi:hypothetical protein
VALRELDIVVRSGEVEIGADDLLFEKEIRQNTRVDTIGRNEMKRNECMIRTS